MMDKCYAQRRNGNYDYNIYNYTTSHVPTMLSIALMKMMAKTECVLFVDSDNSIKYQKVSRKLYHLGFMRKSA